MRYAILFLLFTSCISKQVSTSLVMNVKHYEKNKLVSCNDKVVNIEYGKGQINFLDLNLTARKDYFVNSEGAIYNYSFEVNDVGLIICAVSKNNKSYIISTKGKCP